MSGLFGVLFVLLNHKSSSYIIHLVTSSLSDMSIANFFFVACLFILFIIIIIFKFVINYS